ncbi:iron complex outermembrane receptor protein [Actimicrobium sp. GrIS 1.19]|uniref:TonB-dependent receptor n=1 Tax=Actimicrobium sp. GrIS 1.19 TaxID=3071708 RepID=UPI002E0657B7|nr:iron complex outermembrane receptor protein [Actimicrobium sp. GrIS 1.19]
MMMETVLSRSIRLMCASGMLLGLGLATTAQAQEAAAMQRVEVTGSSIKRSESEGSLQVQTVTREDIQKLGVTSVEQLLTSVTAISAVGASNSAQGVGTTTYGESTASLRGLGSSKTLILVNGRRLASYATDGASVDVNSIPLAAVDHVEILKDGASGVYGSDAIGGVINFILRRNFQGTELGAYTSATKDGGGSTNKASILFGIGDYDADRYNLTLSADVAKETAVKGSQRSYAQDAFTNDGMRDQSATPSGALRTFDPTTAANAGGIVPNSLNSQGKGIGNALSPNNCALNGSSFDANIGTCRFNFAPYADLIPEVTRTNVAANFRFKLSEDTELFAEGFHSHQLTKVSAQSSPYSVSFLAPDPLFATQNVYPAIILNPTNPAYPAAFIAAQKPSAAGQPVTTSYRAFDGGGRIREDVADQSHLVLGARGTFKGYDFDVAYNHNSSDVTESTKQGFQNQVQLVRLLSGNDAFNPYVKNQTPALAAQIYATNYNGQIINSVLTNDALNARISGDLATIPAGVMRFAVGAALVDEHLNLNPSAAYQAGDVSGYGGQALPLSASRNSSALFGELNVPILKNLEADLAVRADRFPTVTSTNPKVSFRFQPVSQLLLRASYGKGFREPSLPELNNPQTFGTSAQFVDPVTGVNNQFNITTGGNPNLKPEKSEQSSVGFVLDPVKGVSIQMDYWRIGVKDLVTTLAPQFIVAQAAAGNSAYTGLVTRDSAGNITNIQSTNLNAGSLKTQGIDVDLRWLIAKTADYGTFSTHLNGTYLTKFDEKLPDGTIQPSIAATIDKDGNALNAVSAGGIIFRWKHQLNFDWKFNNFAVDITQNYQSGYRDAARADSATGTEAEKVGAFSTWDLQGSYTGVKNLTLRAGVKNLLNRKPPQIIGLGNYFQTGFDPSYYDAHSALGYLTANYKF